MFTEVDRVKVRHSGTAIKRCSRASHRRSRWPQVAGLAVLGTVATAVATLTGSADVAAVVVAALLPYFPR